MSTKWDDDEAPKKHRTGPVHYSTAGERMPPIAKPYKRSQCQWVNGIGWVSNPTGRWVNMGDYRG